MKQPKVSKPLSRAAAERARDFFELGKRKKAAGELSEALNAFRACLKINPRSAAAWISLAEVLDQNQQGQDALACYRRAAIAEPDNVIARTRFARSLAGLGRTDDARQVFTDALALDPSAIGTLLGYGELMEDQGEPERAADAYRRVLKQAPEQAEALANLLGLGRSIDISSEIEVAMSRMQSAPNRDKALIGYGLGKALDRLERFDEAFATLEAANTARQMEAGEFDLERFNNRIIRLKKLFSEAFFAQRADWGHPSATPVFVVGLPRSGTTLTEQIIASHPRCFGAGELTVLSDLATGMPDRLGQADPPWPGCVEVLTQAHVAATGVDYVAQVEKRAPAECEKIVDKAPLNFWHLGLVALSLPNARIIHCHRDLRDNGLSIFAQNFNPSQRWATSLEGIAHYWRGYRELMEHWGKVTSLKIHEVRYEDTVLDTESQARDLLEFLDLDWEPSVLEFHRHERAVQTPSRWQVRQPIYDTSKEKWRRYAKHLTPLSDVQ